MAGTSPFPITGFNIEQRLLALEAALKDHIENPVIHTPEESDKVPVYDSDGKIVQEFIFADFNKNNRISLREYFYDIPGKVTKKTETFYKANRAWRILNTVYTYTITALGLELVNREQRKRA